MALALYRKYRPARLAEVVGQEHVTDPLATALTAGRINHAYLFSGPRGCGKTSSARILARSLNCVQGPTPDPCGECESCIALAPEGPGSIDVVELDAASHGGVEDARELRDRAFYAPAESRYRVFIVDEAHMVTTQGFNALLKIVEEPPDHLVFVFATTEPDKVLPTIRSRTHHYPFRLIPPGTMRSLLERICDDEGVTVAPPVYPLVIRAGGGSARDTLSVLDQLLAGAGPEGVTYERAVALLGVTDAALIDDTVDALAAGDGAAVYQAVDRLVEAGHDPRRFAADLLQRLRDLMLVQAVPDAAARGLVDGAEDELERMTDQAARLGPATLARYGEIVHNGLIEMRGATAPRLLLELLCARMLLPAATTSDPGLLERLERIERRNAIAPDARPDEDGARQQFVRPSRRGDGSAEPVASRAVEEPGPAPPSTAEPREPHPSDGSTGAGPSGSGPAVSRSSGAATPGDAPAPTAQAPAPGRPGAGSGDGSHEGRPASGDRPTGQQVSERLAADASAGAGSPSTDSADTPVTPAAGDAPPGPATTDASAEPALAGSARGETADVPAEPASAAGRDGTATVGVAAGSAAAELSAEPGAEDASAGGAVADARVGGAAAADGRAGGAVADAAPGGAASDGPAGGATTDALFVAATADAPPVPGAADARAGAPAADLSAEPADADAPAGAAAPDSPAGAATGGASAGAAAAAAPAGGAATEAQAGGAVTETSAGGAAPDAVTGPAAAQTATEGAATAVSAAAPSATDAGASGDSDAPVASAGAPAASASSGAPAGSPGADAPRPPRDGAPPDAAPPESARPAPSPASLDAAAVRRVWSEILAAARQRSRSTEALLVNATVRAVDGDTLVLTIGSPPLARRLSEPRNTDVIADALHAVLGVRWTVRCDQGDGPAPSRQANARPEGRPRQAPTRPSARDAGLPDPPATPPPSREEGEAGTASARPAPSGRREAPGNAAPSGAERSRPGSRGNGRAAPDGGEPLPPEPPPEDAPPDVDDEESMMAEAAADSGPAGARRDPEVAAMELLSNELGARTIDRG